MQQRGRKSSAALAVISASGIETMRRPEPPAELTEEQAEEWVEVVNRLPADWFGRETHGLLSQYCRHIAAARHVAGMIRALEGALTNEVEAGGDQAAVVLASAKTLDRLLKMQEREGRAISSLATKMRISQQSTYDKSRKKPAGTKKPWEG